MRLGQVIYSGKRECSLKVRKNENFITFYILRYVIL